jgi:hypothetical protein
MTGRVTSFGLAAVAAVLLTFSGCGGAIEGGAQAPETGGASSNSGGSTDTGAGATASGGSLPVASGGSITGGSAPTSKGGTSSVTGGSPATSAGGTTSSTGGTGSIVFTPLCAGYVTQAGVAPTKNGVCAPADIQFCYKTCGPSSVGFKTETCNGGVYVEGSTCQFDPAGDYSCYKLPDTVPASCPATAPQSTMACSVPTCTVCGGTATAQTTGYLDSSGAAKLGYCVCTAGLRWTCAALLVAWPCPGHPGC